MRTRTRTGGAIAAITMVSSICVATANNVSAGHSWDKEPTSTIEWESCFEEVSAEFGEMLPPGVPVPVYECGELRVPLDYTNAHAGTISLALVRLPALDQSQRIGSMFVNPGGPGGSGVEFAVFGAPVLYSPDLRARFDIVGFDPRGIAQSSPLQCFKTLDDAFAIFDSGVVAFPKTRAEARAWSQDERKLGKQCFRKGGLIRDHMSTANVARDMERLREAVGDEQLTFAGYSYGSYVGQTYANMYPDRVRAIVIDGVLDPVQWATGTRKTDHLPFSSRLGSDIGAQATLDEFFRLCDEAGPDLCAFAPNSSARFDALAAEVLASEPLLIPVEVAPGQIEQIPLAYGDLIGYSLSSMYGSDGWFFYASDLALFESVAFGDDAPAGNAAAMSPSASFGVDAAASPRFGFHHEEEEVRYPNVVEGFPGVACADTDNPWRLKDWIRAAGNVSSDNYFRQIWTWASSVCLHFPAWDSNRYAGPWTAETANPVLIASTLYDPATPINGAEAARSLLPNSGLLLVDGWGHTTLGISQCASALSEAYLITQQLPPDRQVCPQDFNPFELFGGGAPGGDAEVDTLTELRLDARERFMTHTR